MPGTQAYCSSWCPRGGLGSCFLRSVVVHVEYDPRRKPHSQAPSSITRDAPGTGPPEFGPGHRSPSAPSLPPPGTSEMWPSYLQLSTSTAVSLSCPNRALFRQPLCLMPFVSSCSTSPLCPVVTPQILSERHLVSPKNPLHALPLSLTFSLFTSVLQTWPSSHRVEIV